MEHIELILTGVSGVVALVSGIIAKIKSRINKAKEAVRDAVKKAEELKNATGEQKKAYAVAIIRQTIRYFSDNKISRYIEQEVEFTNLVNVNKKNTQGGLY